MLEGSSVGSAFWPEDWRDLPPAPRVEQESQAVQTALLPYITKQQPELQVLPQQKAAARQEPLGTFILEQQQQNQLLMQQQMQRRADL